MLMLDVVIACIILVTICVNICIVVESYVHTLMTDFISILAMIMIFLLHLEVTTLVMIGTTCI